MKNLILLLFVLLFFANSYAQNGYTETQFPVMPPATPLPGSFYNDVDFDDSGNVWMAFGRKYPYAAIGIGGGGLAKWNGAKVEVFNAANSELAVDAVISVAYAKGFVWIGTPLGLFRYNRKGNIAANWKVYDSLNDKGLGNKIICLKVIGDNLWIGSEDGFGVLNMNTESFTHFDETLWGKSQSVIVNDIAEGDNGELWVGTNNGLVHKKGATYTLYDILNSGLKNNEISALCWKKSTAELWIGSAAVSSGANQYSGLYRLKNNVIKRIEELSDCNDKTKSSFDMVFQIIEEKQSGDILVVSSAPFSSIYSHAFARINNERIIRYYIKSASSSVIPDFVGLQGRVQPLSLAYNKNNKLWLGVWRNKSFVIDDLNQVPNNRENIGKLANNASATIDINQVNAMVHNTGDMFWDLMSESRYEVPKNSCKSPIFASALWMGGLDAGNNLHLAAMTYRHSGQDYYPGPVDTTTAKGDSISPYNKIWKINRWDIEMLKKKHADGSLANGSYTPPADFLSWPAHGTGKHSYNMAPFVDIDNNGKYEPLKGDYPAIKGEQALYWIFNDNTWIHAETQGLPLGVEVHAMAYAYNCDTIKPGSPNEALNYTTFYEYKIINRSTEKYDSTYFGLWTDVDLGNSTDDKVGCNIPGNFGFVYNGDNNDDGLQGYGTNPPMLSVVFLSDPMTNFFCFNSDFSVMGTPTHSEHYYDYLRSVWKDGSPLTYGGSGYNTGALVKHAFPDLPYQTTGWTDSLAGDKRFLQSAGPYDFEPGGVKTFSYAIVYSREPNQPNGLNTSWAKNMRDVNAIKNWHTGQSFPTCLTHRTGLSVESHTIQNGEVKVVPNPFSGNTSLVFNLNNNEDVNVEVYNMLGQIVYSRNAQMLPGANTVEIELAGQPAGVYMYVLQAGDATHSGRMANIAR